MKTGSDGRSHPLGLLTGVIERADVHEAAFRKVVAFARAEALEAVDGLFERACDAWEAGEISAT